MINLNPTKKKIVKKDLKGSVSNPSKFLAELFNALVIYIDEE